MRLIVLVLLVVSCLRYNVLGINVVRNKKTLEDINILQNMITSNYADDCKTAIAKPVNSTAIQCWMSPKWANASELQDDAELNVLYPGSDFQLVKSNFWYASTMTQLWREANDTCHQLGGELPSLETESKVEELNQFLATTDLAITELWVGLLKNQHETETGDTVRVFYWNKNQPNQMEYDYFNDNRLFVESKYNENRNFFYYERDQGNWALSNLDGKAVSSKHFLCYK